MRGEHFPAMTVYGLRITDYGLPPCATAASPPAANSSNSPPSPPPHSPSPAAPRLRKPNSPDPYESSLEGEGPTPTIITPKILPLPPPTPPQKTAYGDILPRRAWTSSPAAIPNWRPMNGVTRLTVHHSGDGKPFLATSTTDTIRHLQLVRQAHLQRGMVDIAYHFAVDRAGRVWQLRSLVYEGQHVRPSKDRRIFWNEHNIGIVTLGDFNLQSPTPDRTSPASSPSSTSSAPNTPSPSPASASTRNSSKPTAPAATSPPSSKTPAPAEPPDHPPNSLR